MSYTPPSCGAVDFVLRSIVIPSCSAVNFDISTGTTGITSDSSIIFIHFPTWNFAEGYFLISDPSTIYVQSNSMPFEALTEIGSDDSTVYVFSNTNLLHILPDCISDPGTIYIHSNAMNIRAGQVQDLPVKLSSGGMVLSWEKANYLDEFSSFPWKDATVIDNLITVKPTQLEHADDEVSNSWGVFPLKDNTIGTFWDMFDHYDYLVSGCWNSMIVTDKHRQIVYGNKNEIINSVSVHYNHPGPVDVLKYCAYNVLEQQSVIFRIDWNAPSSKDHSHNVPWGPLSYYSFCSTKYFPITDGIVNFKLELQDPLMIGVCHQVTFDIEGYNTDLRCPYKHHRSGRRDSYNNGGVELKFIYPPPLRETYRMMNLVYVKTVLTDEFVQVTSVNIKYDKQSWLWAFTLTIAKDDRGADFLSLIKPDPNNTDIFIDVEISINGWKWICRVESWHESRVFAKDSWTVQGRSPSMELGYPLNQKTSHVFDVDGTATTSGAAIIDAVLDGTILGIDNTGWSIDWTAYGSNVISGFDPTNADEDNWGINPGTFSWVNKTQIEVIQSLVYDIGGFIITTPNCRTNKVLKVIPLFNEPPWHWNNRNDILAPTVIHAIRTSYTTEVGRSYESLPTYNAVYVMGIESADPQGENTVAGIPIVEAYREGVGPDYRVYAPDVLAEGITTRKSAAERGRMVLCDTGEWLKHSLRLFSLEHFGNSSPTITGLVLPGEFIQVEEKKPHSAVTINWYGSVISTDITVSAQNGAVVVSQTIEVMEYLGN